MVGFPGRAGSGVQSQLAPGKLWTLPPPLPLTLSRDPRPQPPVSAFSVLPLPRPRGPRSGVGGRPSGETPHSPALGRASPGPGWVWWGSCGICPLCGPAPGASCLSPGRLLLGRGPPWWLPPRSPPRLNPLTKLCMSH